MDIDLIRMGAVEGMLLEAMRKLQQAHKILNHIKATHELETKDTPVYLEEPECKE